MKFAAALSLCFVTIPAGTGAMAETARTGAAAGSSAGAVLMALPDDYFDRFYFPSNPSAATADGIDSYDDRLENFTSTEVDRQVKPLRGYDGSFEAVVP